VTVRARLLLAAAPLAVALIGLGAFAVGSVRLLGATAHSILAQNYRSVLAAQRMKDALERIDDDAYFQSSGHPEHTTDAIVPERRGFEAELVAEEHNLTEVGERALTVALRKHWDEYQRELDDCLGRPPGPQGQACYFRELAPRFDGLLEGANDILALNQDAMVRKSEQAQSQARRIGAAMIGAAFGALALGLVLSWMLASHALRPLAALGKVVERFGRGEFHARARVHGGAEVAQLAASFNAMADRIEEYRRSSLGEMLQAQLAAQATLDSLSDPVLVFAVDGGIANLNRAAEELLPRDERAAPSIAGLDPPLHDAIESLRAHVLGGKGPFAPRSFDEAVTVSRPDGERVFLPRAAPVYEEGGAVVAATVVLQDVTRLRRIEELRDDVVSAVAHQFRTPLTSLRMAIHLCLDGAAGPLTAKQEDLLYAGREECERLQGIVDELLDLARLQAGSAGLDLEPVSANALLERAAQAVRSAADARGVGLELEAAPGDPIAQVDPVRIQLVFSNLLENALRHSPPGASVVLRAREAEGLLRFEVSDAGPGIPEEDRGRVFERFWRGADRASRGGGAGIGLSIARDVVRAHGGTIGVDSEPGRGSTFWFTLPQSP
jgi:NtrC-family two-component system sensor histidine kinase KinB